MAIDRTSTALISEIKRKVSAPDSQDLYSDDDFCAAMTDVQRKEIVPYILTAVEGYFEQTVEVQTVSGTREYLLPARSIGRKLASVVSIDSDGSPTPWSQVTQKQLDRDDVADANVYAIRGNYLLLRPEYSDSYLLELRYFRRPSDIVPVTSAGQVVSKLGNTLTLDNVPSDWAADTLVDIQSDDEPYDSIADDVSLVSVSGLDVTVADATDISVGDWICSAGECVIPQIPVDLYPILTSYAGLQFLEGLSSPEELAMQKENYMRDRENLFSMITPRVQSSPKGVAPGAHWRRIRRSWW